MRQLLAVALVLAVGAVPACAQRGGARGGSSSGFHGGFSGHAAFAPRSGFSGAGQYRYTGGPHVQSYRPVGRMAVLGSGAAGARFASPGISSTRRGFYNRDRDGRRFRRGEGVPYVLYPYANEGWWDSDYPGYPDEDGYYDDDSGIGSVDNPGAPAESYDDQQPAQYQQGPDEQDVEEPPQPTTVAQAQTVAPTLYESNAVTLVFKDGRPLETIHNYALTRTTLYVTDAHRREIPVADLDLAATEKANRAAGVNFQLPQAEK